MKTRYVVGCMSGTSLDGLDLALVEITGEGLELAVKFIKSKSVSIKHLQPFFKKCINNEDIPLSSLISVAKDFGELHAHAISELTQGYTLDLISVHGQTLFHQPPLSFQLLNPFVIAKDFDCPVVYDLRGLDLACQGEGAPLTPMSDYLMYRQNESCVVLNLGGFANFSFLPVNKGVEWIEGGDICVCNQLLDAIYQSEFEGHYDENGLQASKGKINESLFTEYTLLLNEQAKSKRSLGTNDEMKKLIELHSSVPIQDRLKTLCDAMANVICQNVSPEASQMIIAGGGACNQVLFNSLKSFFKGEVLSSDDVGIPVQARESIGFAVLGALCQDRVAITLPKITPNSAHLVSGAWILP